MTPFLAVLRAAQLRCSFLAISSSEQPAASLHTAGTDLPLLLRHQPALKPSQMGRARSGMQDNQGHRCRLRAGLPMRSRCSMRDAASPSSPLSPDAEGAEAAGGGSDESVPRQTDPCCAGVASCLEKCLLSFTEVFCLALARQPSSRRLPGNLLDL